MYSIIWSFNRWYDTHSNSQSTLLKHAFALWTICILCVVARCDCFFFFFFAMRNFLLQQLLLRSGFIMNLNAIKNSAIVWWIILFYFHSSKIYRKLYLPSTKTKTTKNSNKISMLSYLIQWMAHRNDMYSICSTSTIKSNWISCLWRSKHRTREISCIEILYYVYVCMKKQKKHMTISLLLFHSSITLPIWKSLISHSQQVFWRFSSCVGCLNRKLFNKNNANEMLKIFLLPILQ